MIKSGFKTQKKQTLTPNFKYTDSQNYKRMMITWWWGPGPTEDRFTLGEGFTDSLTDFV